MTTVADLFAGWDKSKGVAAEIAIALELGKPVEYMDLEGAGE